MVAPMLRDGAVVMEDGRVVEVGPAKEIHRRYSGCELINLAGQVIVPGLINSHSHLELSHLRAAQLPHGSFVEWILALRSALRKCPADPAAAALEGARQSMSFGVTHVGDISQSCAATRSALRDGPLRVTSFGEALGLAKLRSHFEAGLSYAVDHSSESEFLRIGICAHSPYTVDLPGYRQCLDLARGGNLPLATHLAEASEEREFVMRQSGPLRGLWEQISLWTDPVETFHGPPIAMARAIGLLDYPAVLAHVNDCTDEELGWLKEGNASVVYCPRTHAYFGRPPHRWRQMLERGINVAVGTDSCASSPDLNLVDELRLLHQQSPDLPVEQFWQMATSNAAKALRCEGGTLAPGGPADLVSFPIQSTDPLREILENHILPRDVWIAGNRVAGIGR